MDECEELQETDNEMKWDKPFYRFQGENFIPKIYDGLPLANRLPDEFNTAIVHLDGGIKADLEWNQARLQAQELVNQGYTLMWEIDLGLFSDLQFSLQNQTQYLSLSLSLEHFRDTLWKEFGSKSVGLIVYRGYADFSRAFPLDEQHVENLREWLREVFTDKAIFSDETGLCIESFQTIEPDQLLKSPQGHVLLSLFCRNMAVEYLHLLTNRLPDTMPRYILLDSCSIKEDPLWQAQLFNSEVYDSLNLIIRESSIPRFSIGWETESPYGYISSVGLVSECNISDCRIGVCMPSSTFYRLSNYQKMKEFFLRLIEEKIPFKVIPESELITNWDGLDYIVYVPKSLSYQGKRKLHGFCAAGGTVVTLGEKLGLAQEITEAELFQVFLADCNKL